MLHFVAAQIFTCLSPSFRRSDVEQRYVIFQSTVYNIFCLNGHNECATKQLETITMSQNWINKVA